MSSLPPNGTYKIENTGSTTGNKFLARNGDTLLLTTDSNALNIRWILKDQTPRGSHHDVATIQSAVAFTDGGQGFFAPRTDNDNEPILYTHSAESITLTYVSDEVFNIRFTKKRSVRAMDGPDNIHSGVLFTKITGTGTATQKWKFVPVA